MFSVFISNLFDAKTLCRTQTETNLQLNSERNFAASNVVVSLGAFHNTIQALISRIKYKLLS